MSERKLPNPPKYKRDEVMTEKDWDDYFECRKIFDHPMPFEEQVKMLEHILTLDSTSLDSPDMPEYLRLSRLIPVVPHTALAAKDCLGFKRIMEFNLYEAKLAYPDDF